MTIANFYLDSVVDGIHPGAKRIWILKRTNYCNSVQIYLVPSSHWHTHSVKNAMVIDVIYLRTRDIHGSTLSSCKTYFEGTGACRKDRRRAFSPPKISFGMLFLRIGRSGFFSSLCCIDWHQPAGIKDWVLLGFSPHHSGFNKRYC